MMWVGLWKIREKDNDNDLVWCKGYNEILWKSNHEKLAAAHIYKIGKCALNKMFWIRKNMETYENSTWIKLMPTVQQVFTRFDSMPSIESGLNGQETHRILIQLKIYGLLKKTRLGKIYCTQWNWLTDCNPLYDVEIRKVLKKLVDYVLKRIEK